MSDIAELCSRKMRTNYFGPAKVVETYESEGIAVVRVTLQLEQSEVSVWARIAVPGIDSLELEDEVLVAGEDINELYVIGLLKHNMPRDSISGKQEIGNGAYTVVDKSLRSPVLQLFSKRNELLFEYDPGSEKTRVNIESGDLEFTTRSGDIVFNSAQNIQLNGQMIDIASRTGIKMAVLDALGQLISSFSLRSSKMKLRCPELAITARRGELQLFETRYVGKKFLGKIEDSQLIVSKLSVIAKSITEKALNVYRNVEQLTQLKTGRMRTLVNSTFHFKAKNTYMKSEQGFKVKADKIHLG